MVKEMQCCCIRVQSKKSEWMDAIFFVSEEDKQRTIEVLKKAVEDFFECGEGRCYENFMEEKLINANIPFQAYYADVTR